jgi:ectoine hydroxylase-related dioxygenase (phytanoyl-CoA dioxygenase family)
MPVSASSFGQDILPSMLGELRDSSSLVRDAPGMRARLNEDGYLFLRSALDPVQVMAARAEVLGRLLEVGEIREPAIDAIATGTSRREQLVGDLGAFWQSVCEGPALRRVTHAGPMIELMERVLGGPVRPFDFLWLRAMPPGRASAFHYDHVYMNRGSDHLLTVWTPLGDLPIEDGPILLMENSHRWDDIIAHCRGFDVDRDKTRPGHVTMEPVTFAHERGCRLLTAHFHPGDVLIMSMFMLHGSLDNASPINRVRLSCDTRYQPATDPIDERWIGPNPIGHGNGYASVSGARPLTAAPIRR